MKPLPDKSGSPLGQRIGALETRKLRARRDQGQGVWYGLGMFGMIGWSVTVPGLVGTALGVWLDRHHPQSFSWTLSLLLAGLVAGCFTAWAWVASEGHEPAKKLPDNNLSND